MMMDKDDKTYEYQQLDQKDLENVSGGNSDELAGDSIVLSKMGFGSPKKEIDLICRPALRREVVKCWADAGVECRYDGFVRNRYYINGRNVTRLEALEYIQKKGRSQACMIDEQNTGSCLCQKTLWPVFCAIIRHNTWTGHREDDRIEKNDS